MTFDASASRDPDGIIATYSWNFGDGAPTASGMLARHKYSVAGRYVAALVVTDDKGASAQASQTVEITDQSRVGIFDVSLFGVGQYQIESESGTYDTTPFQ